MVKSVNVNHPDKLKEEEEKQRIRELGRHDLVAFGKLFLHQDFGKSTSPPFHHQIGGKLLDRTNLRVCNIIPRGFGKTIMSKAAILHALYYNDWKDIELIAFVAEEQSQAISHLRYLKEHIEFNPRLNHYFGDLSGDKRKWTEKEFLTTRGDRIIARGTNQRLRGRAEMATRYTLVVLDDFESELNTKTPEGRRILREQLFASVEPALEESKGREGRIWLQGTIVHYDSVLQSIYDKSEEAKERKNPFSWDVTFLEAETDGVPLWESYFPMKKLRIIRQRFIDAGLPHKYAQEYLNQARDPESIRFHTNHIKHDLWDYQEKNGYGYIIKGEEAIPVHTYIGVDLAYEAGAGHDFQAIVPIHIDSGRNVYVDDYYRGHLPLHEMPAKIFEYAKRFPLNKRVGIEKVGAQGVIKDYVNRLVSNERKLMRGAVVGIKPPSGIKKEDRIEANLASTVNTGRLWIRELDSHLEKELHQFPKSKNDDLSDALVYAVMKAVPPRSEKISIYEFEQQKPKKKGKVKQRISWVTGQYIK